MSRIITPKEFTRRDLIRLASITIGCGALSKAADAAVIGERGLAIGGKSMPTAKDYVQDGLIAMWDGIENAGYGIHDDSVDSWKDLAGNRDLFYTQFGTIESDALKVKGDGNGTNGGNGANQGNKNNLIQANEFREIESCFSCTTWGIIFYSGTPQLNSDKIDPSVASAYTVYGLHSDYPTNSFSFPNSYRYGPYDGRKISVSYVFDEHKAYANGSEVSRLGDCTAEQTYNWDRREESGICMGGFSNLSNYRNSANCRLHSVRVYSRNLTPAERFHNYAVDKARFGIV